MPMCIANTVHPYIYLWCALLILNILSWQEQMELKFHTQVGYYLNISWCLVFMSRTIVQLFPFFLSAHQKRLTVLYWALTLMRKCWTQMILMIKKLLSFWWGWWNLVPMYGVFEFFWWFSFFQGANNYENECTVWTLDTWHLILLEWLICWHLLFSSRLSSTLI